MRKGGGAFAARGCLLLFLVASLGWQGWASPAGREDGGNDIDDAEVEICMDDLIPWGEQRLADDASQSGNEEASSLLSAPSGHEGAEGSGRHRGGWCICGDRGEEQLYGRPGGRRGVMAAANVGCLPFTEYLPLAVFAGCIVLCFFLVLVIAEAPNFRAHFG